MSPLYALTKDNVEWKWSAECDAAFKEVKMKLTNPPVLTHFYPDIPINVRVDASAKAIGSILSHTFEDGSEKPVIFSSRILSEAEKKYPQIEREALALVHAVVKFHQYIYGNDKLTIWTDHKPLTAIFGPKRGIPVYSANRLQRWAFILSPYSFNIKFVSSEDNAADYLSRYVPGSTTTDFDPMQEVSYVHFVHENSPIAIDWNMVKKETLKDEVLSKAYRHVMHSDWPTIKDGDLKSFFDRRNELTIDMGCLLWGHRVIIPSALRPALMKILHSVHFGSSKMKSLARSYFWWPHLDEDLEKLSTTCPDCQKYKPEPFKSPKTWSWPRRPWTRVHLDFFGPINQRHYLVLVDATSKWLECFQCTNTSTQTVIEHLSQVFATFGLPRIVTTDNATAFTSSQFQEFLSRLKIIHLTGSPYHPATNGQAENGVKILKNFLKKSNLMNAPPATVSSHIQYFLYLYRNTPHQAINDSPAHVLLGRRPRTHLSLLVPSRQDRMQDQQDSRISASRSRPEPSKGDTVLARDYRSGKPPWMPGIVLRQNYGTTTVQTSAGPVIRHVDQLLPAPAPGSLRRSSVAPSGNAAMPPGPPPVATPAQPAPSRPQRERRQPDRFCP
ncbi:unnamed protein product [Nesidiocoris tenuis]|uniref:RNA-directed DNA polymerase n=1 Tax=Nesidiocoris tenuis TaxID=355587 RepID=A0A6H5HEP4_9HEMI|nr:unnamed protein product [Nesidiocoris tenuis]CAB0016578.1 unnamed protein product [Nesidiocoris tenuis]